MNVIDKILLEWSYKCHDGIVDLNNEDKVIILREMLDEESNNNLDMFFEANMSPLADEAIQFIKDQYRFDDSNFKPKSQTSFSILLPDKFKLSRTEIMSDLQKINPDFQFDQGSIGKGSSVGRLIFKGKVIIYVKFAKGQGNESSGKVNESKFYTLINSHITTSEDGNIIPITVILKSTDKTLQFDNIIECKDSSKTDATEYAKADAQLININNEVAANISLKKRNAIRWESSKTRFADLFKNFINKALNGQLGDISLQPIQGAKNKYKLYNPSTNQILSKVIVTNAPETDNDSIIFGKDNPKTIVIKEDFERFTNYTFTNNILTINCDKIYTSVDDVMGTNDEPVFAFSNHIGQSYGIEFRVFSKGALYSEDKLKGSKAEIDYNNIK
jgi:hypothetical protein